MSRGFLKAVGEWRSFIAVLSVLAMVSIYAGFKANQYEKAYDLVSALKKVSEKSTTAFVIVDHNGLVTTWSSGAENLFGITAKQQVGVGLGPIIPPDMRPEHRKMLDMAVKRGGIGPETILFQCNALHRDGHEFPVVMSLRSFEDDNGEPMFLAVVNYASDVQFTPAGSRPKKQDRTQ